MRTLRAVFFVHGLITLAGAVVLTAFPTAIPSAVGITMARPDYLLVYLVAAAELAVAVLSFRRHPHHRLGGPAAHRDDVRDAASGERHPRSRLHGADGVNATMIANTVLRFTVVAVFLAVWRVSGPHQTPGTSR